MKIYFILLFASIQAYLLPPAEIKRGRLRKNNIPTKIGIIHGATVCHVSFDGDDNLLFIAYLLSPCKLYSSSPNKHSKTYTETNENKLYQEYVCII